MALNEIQIREHAIATLHKLIESQSIHLSGSGVGMGQTHEGRAKNDLAYLDTLFTGLVELYRKSP